VLAEFAKDFEKRKVKLPDGSERMTELRRMVFYLSTVGTKESDLALYALADREHPAHDVAREAILAERPSVFEKGVWFRHPYCLTILRQALEDTTLTGSTYKVEGDMVRRYERKNVLAGGGWSSSDQIPGIIDDPALRRAEAKGRVCDDVALKLQDLVWGIGSYHPLLKERDKRLVEFRAFLDRFKGRLSRLNGVAAKLFDFDPKNILYIPDILPLDRPATEEEVKAGRAVFHLGGKGKLAGQRFPATAHWEGTQVLIVQAEIGPDGKVTYGVISHSGLRTVSAAKLSNIRTALK
jgi:hypothetical protein